MDKRTKDELVGKEVQSRSAAARNAGEDFPSIDPSPAPVKQKEEESVTFELLYEDLPLLSRRPRFREHFLELVQSLKPTLVLDNEEINMLYDILQCYESPPGRKLINQGESGNFMLIIFSGECEIYHVHRLDVSVRRRLGTAGPGAVLGEMSLVDGSKRFATCETRLETIFGVIDQNRMSRLVLEHPALGSKILMLVLQLLCRRLRSITSTLIFATGVSERP